MKRRAFFRTEFGVLICLALALPAASHHVCAQPPGVDPLHDKIKKMERDIREWQKKGRDLSEIGKLIQKIGPLIQSGQRAQAEVLVDRATTILASPPKPLEVVWESLEAYRRETDETQYLVFPIREVGYLFGGIPDRFLQALEEMKQRLGTVENSRRRNWGFHFMIPSWRVGSKQLPLTRGIEGAFDAAIRTEVALYITIENLEWSPRPDLWNYNDPDQPGYDPENVRNVEWMDWDGTPHPHRYRNWGTPEQMPPVICYNSPTVLREVARLIDNHIAPPIRAGIDRLKREKKSHLFGGVTVGAEPALPNYEGIARRDPRIAEAMERDGVPRVRLGYNALTNLGYSKTNPPEDFSVALAAVNHAFVEYWANGLADAGIPSDKMYTHVAAGAGVVGSPGVKFTNAPISIAFVQHARPGWTTYPEGPFRENLAILYQALAEHDNPHWASTEASPSGLGSGGVQMKDYLRWHFDYGATVMVFNVGATSAELSQRLNSAVWGDAAINAYREFLNPKSQAP